MLADAAKAPHLCTSGTVANVIVEYEDLTLLLTPAYTNLETFEGWRSLEVVCDPLVSTEFGCTVVLLHFVPADVLCWREERVLVLELDFFCFIQELEGVG